jgi:hypothetical protein
MFTDKIKKDGHPDYAKKKILHFQDECSASYDYGHGYVDPISIACSEKGHTPLAGAAFKLKHTGPFVFDCGSGPIEFKDRKRYVCVSGCTESVPKFLEEEPSCD